MPELTELLVTAHLVSTLVMVGVIWTVQIVHYPLMALVGRDDFVAYETAHAPRMAAVVMLPWAVQGATVAGLLLTMPARIEPALIWAAALAAAIPVVVTVIASVPAHSRLAIGFDADVHRRLVVTNWIRTAGWTVHGVIAVAMSITAG
jgi:hypothetical protein